MGRGLYPGVRQKSPEIDLMFGLHKQLIENVVKETTLTNLGSGLGFHSVAASLGDAYEGPCRKLWQSAKRPRG